jgi:GNAT superfamily N-acetyltransferase
MIRAGLADRAAIKAVLGTRAELAMFPLNNLTHHGMQGGHPYAVTMWTGPASGTLRDVLTHTDNGMVMPYLPTGDFAAAAQVLRGRSVAGIVGAKAWVRGLEAALGLQGAAKSLDHDEPHFLLDLAQLQVPDGPGRIVPLGAAPVDRVKAWMLDYQLATLNTPATQAIQRVEDSYAQYVQSHSHVAMMDGDTPLAMTGFNARMPDIVQIGGVYTPPELRGRGHARRALALHLAQVRDMGVGRATLFSASVMATRAYRAIGFREIGEWTLLILMDKEVINE